MGNKLTKPDAAKLREYLKASNELAAREPQEFPGEKWEEWHKEVGDLQERYHDVIVKALRYALTLEADKMAEHPQVDDLISVLLVSIEAAAPAQALTCGTS